MQVRFLIVFAAVLFTPVMRCIAGNDVFIPGQEGYPFSQGLAPVYDARYSKDVPSDASYEVFGKYGFIDKAGRLVIPFLYEKAEPFSDGLALAAARRGSDPAELKYGYVDLTGDEVIALEFEDGRSFSEGLAPAKKDGKWGFISKNGEFQVKPSFDDALPFHEGLAAVKNEGGDWGFIDKKGKLVVPFRGASGFPFSEGLSASVERGKSSSLINRNGEVSVTFKDGVTPSGSFSEGLIAVSVSGDDKSGKKRRGFADRNGNVVVPLEFESVYDFHEGLAAVKKDGKYGFIDKSGNLKIPYNFTISEGEFLQAPPIFSEGLAFVRGGYIDRDGNFVLRSYEAPASE